MHYYKIQNYCTQFLLKFSYIERAHKWIIKNFVNINLQIPSDMSTEKQRESPTFLSWRGSDYLTILRYHSVEMKQI